MKKALAFVFLASLILRLWIAFGYWADKPLTQDAKEYLELASNFNKTGSFQYDEHHTLQIESYGRAPGYPFWLSLLLRLQSGLIGIRAAEVVLNLLSTYFFFLLGKEMFGYRAGVAAFVLSSLYLPFVSLVPPVLSENLWICVLLPAYLYLFRISIRPQLNAKRNVAIVVGLMAIATLIRPGTLFLLPFIDWWIGRFLNRKMAWTALLLYFLLLLPWNLYLYRQQGRVVFVASEGAVTFWTGMHPRYSGDGDLAVNPDVQKEYRDILSTHEGEPMALRERFFYRDGIANILTYRARYILIEIKKLIFGFLPFGASVTKTSVIHQITGIGFYLPLLFCALLGIRKTPPEPRWFVIGVAACYTLMILLFFPQERFRIATLDPILMLLAAYTVSKSKYSHSSRGRPESTVHSPAA